jgi:hypothetical protein
VTEQPAARVRVTGPRTGPQRTRPRRSNAAEIDAQTGLGEVYVQSLMRAQLRLAGVVVLVLVATLGTLPLVLRVLRVDRVHVAGVPLPWLVLGVLVYPWLIALAVWYVRRAERNEEAFEDLVEADR